MAKSPPPVARRRGRQLLLVAIAVTLGGVALELGAFALLRWSTGTSVEALRARRSELTAPLERVAEQEHNPWLVPHPYLGYVASPGLGLSAEEAERARPTTHGLGNPDGPIQRRAADRLVVAILGGSVAHDLYTIGGDALSTALSTALSAASQRVPGLAGREIHLVNLALPGYKQPQQLIALSYVLGLGAQFDVVINLDGFNEVAIPPVQHLPYRFNPFYPRGWNVMAQSRTDPSVLRFAGVVHIRKLERRELARGFDRPMWSWSNTALLVWKWLDARTESAIAAAQRELADASSSDGSDFASTGPRFEYDQTSELYERLVAVWHDCSRRMHDLCAADGTAYLHCLQPNQYVAESKPLTAWEREWAAPAGSEFRVPASLGYPLLRTRGLELAVAGVDFVDLTRVFAATVETVYADSCCHLNERGNHLLAAAIAGRIARRDDLLDRLAADVVPPSGVVRLRGPTAEIVLTRPYESRVLEIEAETGDGLFRPVGAGGAWSVADPSVATVSRLGVVRGLRPGHTEVRVELGGCTFVVAIAVRFAAVVPFGDGSQLDAAVTDAGRLRLVVHGVPADATATLFASPETVRFPWCGRHAYLPLERAIAWPLTPGAEGVDRVADNMVVNLAIPAACRGTTTYWQCVFTLPEAPCGWSMTRGVAITLD